MAGNKPGIRVYLPGRITRMNPITSAAVKRYFLISHAHIRVPVLPRPALQWTSKHRHVRYSETSQVFCTCYRALLCSAHIEPSVENLLIGGGAIIEVDVVVIETSFLEVLSPVLRFIETDDCCHIQSLEDGEIFLRSKHFKQLR